MTTTITNDVSTWFKDALPGDWFAEPPEVTVDTEEILVVGRLPEPGGAAEHEALKAWREQTRERRMEIARRAEDLFGRKVSWGARCGTTRRVFTTANVPVMTRLRIGERSVLDTLVASGVARSRSEALAWCVRLVGRHEADWLSDLRDALVNVGRVRAEGPTEL